MLVCCAGSLNKYTYLVCTNEPKRSQNRVNTVNLRVLDVVKCGLNIYFFILQPLPGSIEISNISHKMQWKMLFLLLFFYLKFNGAIVCSVECIE